MTGFTAQVDQNVAATYDEAHASGTFAPLPKGKYQARIVPLSPKDGKDFEVAPFAKNNEAYAGKQVLRLRAQILDESPTGAKRTFFLRVPLFSKYAPSPKNPQGAPARDYFSFFEKVAGASKEQVLAGQLPGWEAIDGKFLTLTLSEPTMPDQYNDLGSNDVDFIDGPGSIAATPLIQPGTKIAPWLTPDGALDPNWVSPAQQAQQAIANAQPPAYGGAPAAPSAPSSPAAPQAPQAPAGEAPAWGQNPNPALQAAAANGGGGF